MHKGFFLNEVSTLAQPYVMVKKTSECICAWIILGLTLADTGVQLASANPKGPDCFILTCKFYKTLGVGCPPMRFPRRKSWIRHCLVCKIPHPLMCIKYTNTYTGRQL